MKNQSNAAAYNILEPIFLHAARAHHLPSGDCQTVIDATDHPDDGVAIQALSIIGKILNKRPFEATLIKHAMDHSKPARATAAYIAMDGTSPLASFYPAIQAGCKAADRDIALGALFQIFVHAKDHYCVPPALHQAVMDGVNHPDDGVATKALFLIGYVSDKSPFETTLIKHAMDHSNPARAAAAYVAMEDPEDLTPFYPAIQEGCKAAEPGIVLSALSRIFSHAWDGHATEGNYSLPPALHQAVIDAADHPDDNVIEEVLSIIALLRDKSSFETTLIKHAIDHTKPDRAITAYKAMDNAWDLAPFYPVIQAGCESADRDIVLSALSPIFSHAAYTHSVPPALHQTVIDAAYHPDDDVAKEAISIMMRSPS